MFSTYFIFRGLKKGHRGYPLSQGVSILYFETKP
jgi:hypothetical protein